MTPWSDLEQKFQREEREMFAQIERAEVLRAHVLQHRIVARSLAMGNEGLLREARNAASCLEQQGGRVPSTEPAERPVSPLQKAQRCSEEHQGRNQRRLGEIQERLLAIGLALVDLSRGNRTQSRSAPR